VSRSARSLRWLGSFADPQRGIGWNPRSHPDPAWNVRRTRALLDLAGAPDQRLECVLVAGTKGKGSTAAFLASILGAAGVRARCREVGPLPVTATLGIRGEHQLQNAALAAEAARALPGVSIDERAIRHGLRRVRWPGRFEAVAGRPPVVLDGAHNAESAEALAATLRPFLRGRPLHLVIGMRRDKDARATLRPLLSLATAVYATAATDPRALSPDELAARGRRPVQTASDVGGALERARAAAGAQGVVCVTGSLALIGEARTALGLPIAERLWAGTAGARRERATPACAATRGEDNARLRA